MTVSNRQVAPGLVLTVMCAGMFLVLLDVTVVNVALPAISGDLDTGTAGLQWVVDGYAVSIASLLLAGGTLGDRFGHRRVVLAGLVVFGAASLGCGLATGTGVLVAARAVQGAGAALLLPGSIAVITDAYQERAAQARALGIWAGVSSLALPAGPLLGGALVSSAGWRLVFLVNIPVVLVVSVAVLRLVRPARWRRERRLDLPGMTLAMLALGTVIFTVIEEGHRGVDAGWVLVTVAACAGFVLRQRFAAAPLLPLELFRRQDFAGANLVALLMNGTVNGTLFVITLYLQRVYDAPPLLAGIALLPLFTPLAALAPVAGRLTARYGPRRPMLAGIAVAGLGATSMLLVDRDHYWRLLPTLLGLGVGAGLLTAAVVAAALRSVPADRAGLASGVNNTARQAGTATGVAVFGAVAGDPADAAPFLAGLHHLAVLGAVLWLAALLLTLRTVRQAST